MSLHRPHPEQVLVGTDRVAIVGLRSALEKVAAAGLRDREAVVDFLLECVSSDNFIPPARAGLYRAALWREHLRSRGEDFSEFYSEIPVTVRGEAGEERDRFVDLVGSIFAEMELRPVVSLDPGGDGSRTLELVIDDQLIARGPLRREDLRAAIHKSLSGW